MTATAIESSHGVEVTAASLALACGANEDRVAARFGDAATSRARRYAHGGLVPVMASYCEGQHMQVPLDRNDLVEAVCNLDREMRNGGQAAQLRAQAGSAGTFALAVSLAGEVLVRAAFDASAAVARTIAASVEVPSFRPHTSVSLETTAPFARVPPGGALPVAGLSDDRRGTGQLETSGVALLVPRSVLVNDSLGVMAAIFADLGRLAALAVDHELFKAAVMEGSDVFYTSARGNRLTGSALSSTTLGTAEAAIWAQKDGNGRSIGARPRTLLVPPELSHTARALLAGQGEGNNRLSIAVSPLLSMTGMPGASATTWYLASDPATLPAFQVLTLAGRPAPSIEEGRAMTAEGIRLRAFYDFAAVAADFKGAVKASA